MTTRQIYRRLKTSQLQHRLSEFALHFHECIIDLNRDARVGESADTLRTWLLPPTIAGFVVAVVLVSVYGWWRLALSDRRRLPRWAAFVPALAAVVALVNMLLGNYTTVTPQMWVYLIPGDD